MKDNLNDYILHIQNLYNEYLEKTEDRDISYGELFHIQNLNKHELNELEKELLEELKEE